MRSRLRRVLLFALQFPPLLLVFVLLYPWVVTGYRTLLLAAINPVAGTFRPPLRVETIEDGRWRLFEVRPDTWASVMSIRVDSLDPIHAGVALLPALLLATPAPWLRRLRLLGVGLGLLFVLQALTHLAFFDWWVDYQRADRFDLSYQMLVLFHSIAGQLLPVVLWGALTWRDWFSSAVTDTAEAVPGRNRPCPCGSGRKFKHCCGAGL